MIRPASHGRHSTKSAGEPAGPVLRGPQRLTLPETTLMEDVQAGTEADDVDKSDLSELSVNSAAFRSEGLRISTPSGSLKNGRPVRRRVQTLNEGQLVSARTPTPSGASRGAPSPRGSVQTPRGSKISTAGESLDEVRGDAEAKPMTRARLSAPRAKTADDVSASDLDMSDLNSAVPRSEDPDVSGSPKNGRPVRRRVQTLNEGQLWSARTASHGKSRGSAPPLPSPRGSRGKVEPIDAALTSAGSMRSESDFADFVSAGEFGKDFMPGTPRRAESLSGKKASKGAPRLSLPEDDGQEPQRPSSSMSMTSRTDAEPQISVRRLSFVGITMTNIWEAIQEEEPFLDWLPEFWDRVLTAPCPAACKTLALRSLANWVAIYNRWQAVGEWKPGQAPRFFNAFETQQMLGIPLPRVMEFARLFDPPGYARAHQTKSPQDYVRIKLPVSPLITVCILMSTAISKKQKVRFLLGLFDENDNRTFEEEEFVEMLLALFRGMAAMFNMLNLKDAMPSKQRMEVLATRLFRRIIDFYRDKTGYDLLDESVPFSVIEDWLLGESNDALNAPFALFIYRYSTPGEEEDPELFEDEDRKFRLSHTAPVDPPLETAASLDATFLNRHEIVVVHKLFNHCLSSGGFGISHSEAEAVVGPVDQNLWIDKLHRALDATEDARGVSRTTFTSFLKRICPKASGRHLRMFHSWIKEYQHLEELQQEVSKTRLALRSFQEFIALPKLPASMRQEMSLDWQARALHSQFEDYVENSCPPGFRAFDGNPAVDKVMEELLQKNLEQQELSIQQWTRLFAPRKSAEASLSTKPAVLKPRAPVDEWQSWNYVLDLLEVPTHGHADRENLIQTRLVSPELVDFLLKAVAKRHGLDRNGFLLLMCQLKNYRPWS